MKDIETLKQEAKEDKEFCTIKTKKLKGLLNEIDRLTTYSRKLLDENIDLSNETNRLKARLEEGEKARAFIDLLITEFQDSMDEKLFYEMLNEYIKERRNSKA